MKARMRFGVRTLMMAVALAAVVAAVAAHILRQPGGLDPLLLPVMGADFLGSVAASGLILGIVSGLRTLPGRSKGDAPGP